jgi:CRP-like cAMP-binding protein
MRMSQRSSASNHLLATLSRADYNRFLTRCERVELPFAAVLTEPGERIHHVYFPISGYISLQAPADKRASMEVGLIGNEGMLGIARLLDIDLSPLRAVVAGSGLALRMPARAFTEELGQIPALHQQLNRYLYALMAQFAQSATCARYHNLTARLARWLLMTHDRAESNQFFFTHEFFADILGVRRVGVTVAAGTLQRSKLISYRRGNIEILNRRGLEAVTCNCYATIKATYARFLS